MLSCELVSLREKLVVTGSVAQSARILRSLTHFGAVPHSLETLVWYLAAHPAVGAPHAPPSQLSSLEKDFLVGSLTESLAANNYFKAAMVHQGVRARLLACMDEFRIHGRSPADLRAASLPNQRKQDSLVELFTAYCAALDSQQVVDYPATLHSVTAGLRSKAYDAALANVDIVCPLPIDARGGEVELIQLLKGVCQVYESNAQVAVVKHEAGPNLAALRRLQISLNAHLERQPLLLQKSTIPLDISLRLKASLLRSHAIADAFHWLERGHASDATEVAFIAPDYDAYAGPMFQFCRDRGIPFAPARGIKASECAFFAKTMAAFTAAFDHQARVGRGGNFCDAVRTHFDESDDGEPAFEAFRSFGLTAIDAYERATARFNIQIESAQARDALRAQLLSFRMSPRDLGLGVDGIFFGHPDDAIGLDCDRLVALGLQDHCYPPRSLGDGILSDDERLSFGLPARTVTAARQNVLERLCVGVRSGLYLGFESHDLGDGSLTLPSSFLNRVLAALGHEVDAQTLYSMSGLPEEFAPCAIQNAEVIDNPFLSLDEHLAASALAPAVSTRWEAELATRRSPVVGSEDRTMLSPAQGDPLSISASGLATYYSCPYKFYLKSVARIPIIERLERESLVWLDRMQRGTFLHAVFEGLTQAYLGGGGPSAKNWQDFLTRQAPGLLGQIIAAAGKDYEASALRLPETIVAKELEDIRETGAEFIKREINKVIESGFYPLKAEAAFKDLTYSWEDEGQRRSVSFHGIVDRLDTNGRGLYRVLDYKTGGNHFGTKAPNLYLDGKNHPHFQHAIYGYWALKSSGYDIRPESLVVGYYFSSAGGGWKAVDSNYLDIEPQFKNSLVAFHREQRTGEYAKNAASCRYCDFKLVCGGLPQQRYHLGALSPQIARLAACLTGTIPNDDEEAA